jgi:hypothetical protein
MNAVTETLDRRVDAESGEILGATESDFERLLNKQTSARDLLLDDNTFERIWKIADSMANGKSTVPKHLQGMLADCVAVVTQAFEWGMNPYAVAQKTHVVNGALGYEAQLVNAVVQRSGAIRGHFHYEYRGDGSNLDCRVGAVLRGDNEITFSEWLNVNAPTTKNSPLWKTNPRQQLGYLQVKNWCRAFAPGAILGVYTPDELEEIEPPAKSGPRRKSDTAADAPAPEKRAAAPAPAAAHAAATPASSPAAAAPSAGGALEASKVAYLRNKLKATGVSEQSICDRFQVGGIELLSAEQFDTVKSELLAAS